METLILIGWIILAIFVITGIIRVMFKPSNSIGELIIDLLWLDVLGDLLGWIFEIIGDLLDD